MIHKNNTSLNDLFRSAQSETEQEVISQREVERLLRNSSVRSVPVTHSIGQKLFERLLSTPLKIGMTAMTTAACITLGLIAFWPATQQAVNKAPILSYTTNGSRGTAGASINSSQNSVIKPTFLKSHPNPALSNVMTIPTTLIATADSLHPVDATPEQLAKLGIVLEDNGDIDFYTKEGNEINKFGLPPTWGVRLHLDEKIPKADTMGIVIQKNAPRLVTELNGAKRLFSFESDTTISMKDGNRTMLLHTETKMRITPDHRSKSSEQNQKIVIKMAAGSGGDRNVEVNTVSDSLPLGVHTVVNTRVNVAVNDSDLSRDAAPELETTNIDSIIAHINIDSILTAVNVDSMVKSASADLHGQNLDSAMKEVKNASIMVKKLISSIRVKVDTSGNASNNPSVDVELNDDDNNDLPGIPPTPPIKEMEQAANSLDLSKLVPIRVVNMKNPAHPNQLIFWYEPTPEVQAAIPRNSVSEISPKGLAISIYPNPTSGPAMVHYELSNAPKAYFSVRNLLGQEVMNGGMTSGVSGDANLNLSQLPAGVYLLVTTTDNGERDVERVVVTK